MNQVDVLAAGRAAADLWPRELAALTSRAALAAAVDERARAQPPSLAHLAPARALELSVHAALLAAWCARALQALPAVRRRPAVIGLNGGQGSGKSTLAALVAAHLRRDQGVRTLVLSLDDLYLDKASRQALAAAVHPLFATRGVPGTHDVALGLTLLARLRAGVDPDQPLVLPAFDKATDDRVPEAEAPRLASDVDLVLFEGWCVGATPQAPADLLTPVNSLEAEDDADGRWRERVNAALDGPYAHLFAALDALVMLRVPHFGVVHRWREEQEAQLRRAGRGGMSTAAVARFVAHYERLTRHMLRTLPARAELILDLDVDHGVGGVRAGGARSVQERFSARGPGSPS
ncbi:MAG TPA: hypothetical protein VLA56_09435 [Pseudomonadales bacterium]|nr:hypothetical protein [Pseudomonadales bacterium]